MTRANWICFVFIEICKNFNYFTLVNEVQGVHVYRYSSVCPFVGVLVQIRVRPVSFLCFDITIPYMAHRCITVRRTIMIPIWPWHLKYSSYSKVFNMSSVCDLWFLFAFTLAYHIWNIGVSPLDVHGPDTILTFLRVFDMSSCATSNFYLLLHWIS